MEVTQNPERYSRSKGVLDAKILAGLTVAVIGTGAVGSEAAKKLATMGIGTVVLVDFDKVEAGNLGAQGWPESDIGKLKVDALAAELTRINPACKVVTHAEEFKPEHIKGIGYVFSCVDNMDVRKEILLAHAADPLVFRLFAEGRMGAEVCRAFCAWDDASKNDWLATWFPQSEAFTDGCVTKATIYGASVTACILINALTHSIRGMALAHETEINMLALTCYARMEPEAPKVKAGSEVIEIAVKAAISQVFQQDLGLSKEKAEELTGLSRS